MKCEDCGASFERRFLNGRVPRFCPECASKRGRARRQTPEYKAAAKARNRKWNAANGKRYKRKWYESNRDRIITKAKTHYAANRNRQLDAQRIARYGLSPSELARIKTVTACEVCGTSDPGGRWGIFSIDHDHDTGRVRGVLCHGCNVAIGNVRDDPTRLRKLAAYLEAAA